MPLDFIFMLTRNDETLPNALSYAQEAIEVGVTRIGFKDVGITLKEMKALTQFLQHARVTTYLEVVSLDAHREIKSAEIALQLKVDYLLGGTHPHLVAPLVEDHPIKYFPFVGSIQGHPSTLHGTIPEIKAHATEITQLPGVDGLDLLAYRFNGDVPLLIENVRRASLKPIIVAGSVHNKERIEVVKNSGVLGFTVGTAAFENRFDSQNNGLKAQLSAILKIIRREQ